MTAIEVQGGAVRLGGRTVWSGVDLTVPAGEFVAVLGPNGVGKSTLVRAILGLQPLSAGTVRVLGRAPANARRRVGYLPQRRSFERGLPVRGVDVVRLGADGTRWGVPLGWGSRHDAVRRRVDEVITSETLSALYQTAIEVLRTSDGRLVVVGQPEAPAYHHDRHAP